MLLNLYRTKKQRYEEPKYSFHPLLNCEQKPLFKRKPVDMYNKQLERKKTIRLYLDEEREKK